MNTIKPASLAAQLQASVLISQGYRRVSWKHHTVARIDRPDWLTVLAEHLHRAPADFYRIQNGVMERWPAANWCDHYRRCMSKDSKVVALEVIGLIPSSDHDQVGYIEIKEPLNLCSLCHCTLDVPGDRATLNCGGDCLRCMALAGDPACVAEMRFAEPTNKQWEDAP